MIWARWAGVMGVPMKWEIARIFVVGTGGSGFCAETAPSGVIGFFMAVAPYSSFGILLLIVSVFDARTASAGRRRRHSPSVETQEIKAVREGGFFHKLLHNAPNIAGSVPTGFWRRL